MKQVKQPVLPGCHPVPLKFKDVPAVNGSGDALAFCEKCQGSGQVCTAEKTSINKLGATVTEKLPEFAGTLRRQRERGGYTVVGVTCATCRGAGLFPKGGLKS